MLGLILVFVIVHFLAPVDWRMVGARAGIAGVARVERASLGQADATCHQHAAGIELS